MGDVEKIQQLFSHQEYSPSRGRPTYEGIKALHKILNVNAAVITSNLGIRAHGLLALTIGVQHYHTLTGAVWLPPINLGPIPVISINADPATI